MTTNSNKKGILLVIISPSGGGKGSIIAQLLNKRNDLFLSVSATTRSPRAGEEEGVHYYFKDKAEFLSLIQKGEMLEYAEYCDNLYGTPKAPIEQQLAKGNSVILEIETNGASQVKKLFPDCVTLFIAPPSLEILKSRLINRGTETMEVVEKRIETAKREMEYQKLCDYVVVNDVLEDAVEKINGIIDKSLKNIDE